MKIEMKRIRRNIYISIKNEDVLKEHKKVDNEGWKLPTIYVCDLCEKSCNSQIEFKKHADELHREKNATNVIISVKVNYF